MKSLNEIAYSIRNQVTGFFPSDDERIQIEFVYKKIHDVRMLMLKELERENGYIDPAYYQKICCLEIKCDLLNCKGISSTVKQHYIELPQIAWDLASPMTFFGDANFNVDFRYIPIYAFPFAKNSPYTGSSPYYTRVDNKAVLGNIDPGWKYMCAVAVLEDPLGSCLHLKADDEYPIPLGKVHQLELIVIKQILSVIQVPFDVTQNAQDDKLMGQQSNQKDNA